MLFESERRQQKQVQNARILSFWLNLASRWYIESSLLSEISESYSCKQKQFWEFES